MNDREFLQEYKRALDSNVSLNDFSVQVHMKPGSVKQRVSKLRKMLKNVKSTVSIKSLDTGKHGTPGRKPISLEKIRELLDV